MSASDALSDFSSESDLGQNASVEPSAETGMVTLAELVASNVPLKWYEAVAIVQETCDVAASSALGVHIPELAGIEITERGSVRVQPGNPQGDAVSRAAHTLGALLTDPELPVKLRLLIEVTSTSPQYLSLAELSKDLQQFERPRRAPDRGRLSALAHRDESASAVEGRGREAGPKHRISGQRNTQGCGQRPHPQSPASSRRGQCGCGSRRGRWWRRSVAQRDIAAASKPDPTKRAGAGTGGDQYRTSVGG